MIVSSVRSLADDCKIVIKKAGRGSCVVVWDSSDSIKIVKKQLTIKQFKDVPFNKNFISNLTEKTNKIFENLKCSAFLTEK